MPTVKDAIIMIKNSLFIYLILRCEYIILKIKVSKDTIVNCWRKSGLIDCKETRKEVENLIELKLIGREAFFKQFIHKS